MGSIKNVEDRVIVTFEVERMLQEHLRMVGDGKLHRSTNATIADMLGWVLWSMLAKNMPKLNFSEFGPIQTSYDKEAGTFVAVIKKQR